MHFILSNVSSKNYIITAYIIATILIEDLSVNEQNSLGNFLELIGQIILTNAAQEYLNK
jgi:hypothetical protein